MGYLVMAVEGGELGDVESEEPGPLFEDLLEGCPALHRDLLTPLLQHRSDLVHSLEKPTVLIEHCYTATLLHCCMITVTAKSPTNF